MVVHTFNPRIWEAEASLYIVRQCLKNKIEKPKQQTVVFAASYSGILRKFWVFTFLTWLRVWQSNTQLLILECDKCKFWKTFLFSK